MSSFDFRGKVAVVTGGTTGIGLATARRFIDAGAEVVLTGQDEGRLEEARRALPRAMVVRSDARQIQDAGALADAVRERHGRVDALFLNAGIFRMLSIADLTEAHYDEQFDTNVRGVAFTLKALLPLMDRGSSVVINASTVAQRGGASFSIYVATKGAVRAMSRALAIELAPKGIRVNSISPGITVTEGLGKAGMPLDALGGLTAGLPIPRPAAADEIAAAVAFLSSTEASYINGSDLLVDGGYAA